VRRHLPANTARPPSLFRAGVRPRSKIPEGEVLATLTTAGSIESPLLQLMKARGEFQVEKPPAMGYAELKRMKDKDRDSTLILDNLPDRDQDSADEVPKEEAKTVSFEPCIFERVPQNLMDRQVFSILGMNHPG
jgi:hypothetical protein